MQPKSAQIATMTPDDFRASLKAAGLSQARLGRLLDLDKATPNRWAMGSASVPVAVAMLLKLLASGRVTVDELEAL